MPMYNNRLANGGRIRELDGIRGLAILLILILHYFVEITPTKYALLFRLAWSGVDLFFVLSGFLIAGILLDAKNSASYYRTFYLRRFYRIIPVYAIWLGIFVVAVLGIGSRGGPALTGVFNAGIPLWTYFLFLQNFAMAILGGFGSYWMGITWSLAVEEQFYLVLPLLVRRLTGKGLLAGSVAVILVAPALRFVFHLSGSKPLVAYTLLPTRADALAFGVLLALAYRHEKVWHWLCTNRTSIYLVFLLLMLGIVAWTLLGLDLTATIGFSWLAALYSTLMLLVLAKPGPLERRVFGGSPLVNLGTVAYAVYLFHSGVLHLFHYLAFRNTPIVNSPLTLMLTLLALFATLLLAQISWRFLEKPLIRRGHARYRYVTSEPSPV
jgi:peptidoglycan/LPS O-acetylase OafA/YrhL